MSDYYNKYNKRELKREIKKARRNTDRSPVIEIQLGKMEDNYKSRFGALDFRKGGMVVSTVDNRKVK